MPLHLKVDYTHVFYQNQVKRFPSFPPFILWTLTCFIWAFLCSQVHCARWAKLCCLVVFAFLTITWKCALLGDCMKIWSRLSNFEVNVTFNLVSCHKTMAQMNIKSMCNDMFSKHNMDVVLKKVLRIIINLSIGPRMWLQSYLDLY